MRRITMIAGLITMLATPAFAGPFEIWLLQACLTRLGYHTGGVDGIVGHRTSRALDEYMTTHFGKGWLNVPARTTGLHFWAECERTMPTETR